MFSLKLYVKQLTDLEFKSRFTWFQNWYMFYHIMPFLILFICCVLMYVSIIMLFILHVHYVIHLTVFPTRKITHWKLNLFLIYLVPLGLSEHYLIHNNIELRAHWLDWVSLQLSWTEQQIYLEPWNSCISDDIWGSGCHFMPGDMLSSQLSICSHVSVLTSSWTIAHLPRKVTGEHSH